MDRIYRDDTAVIEASLFDDQESPVTISSAYWEFQRPDGIPLIVDSAPVSGMIVGDRFLLRTTWSGFPAWTVIIYNGTTWNSIGSLGVANLSDNTATLMIPGAAVYQVGIYTGRVQFTLPTGESRSVPQSFEALDPLPTLPATNTLDWAVDRAWMKLEDLWDSELGGPWVADKTKRYFNKDKIRQFLPDALYMINNAFIPITSFDDTNFPTDHMPLLSQGLLIESIYQLIRSYVEQATPAGSNISWFDRRDYMQRWQSVLQTEEQKFYRYLDLFHQAYLGFGSTSLLIGGYSSPITRLSKFWRTQHPRWIGPYGV